MLIKLRIGFYQVECDAFANQATELLDIRPNFRRAMSPVLKARELNNLHGTWFVGAVFEKRVDLPVSCRNIKKRTASEGRFGVRRILDELN